MIRAKTPPNIQQTPGITTNRTVRGKMNVEGNTIDFDLGRNVFLFVYRNSKGEWIARFTGLPQEETK